MVQIKEATKMSNTRKDGDFNLDQELISKIINQEKVNKLVLYDELAKSMSCKKSLKANMNILNEEVTTLLNGLDKCEMPFTCPHGRPTLIKFTKYELEKLFKRVI